MIYALIIAILFAFMFLCTVVKQDKQIKQLKEDLSVMTNSENYYRRVIDGFREKMREEEEKYVLIQADYCTSESDINKYNSQKAMENAIRTKMAMLIGNDIVKKFEPRILPLGEGKQKYSLLLKVKKI